MNIPGIGSEQVQIYEQIRCMNITGLKSEQVHGKKMYMNRIFTGGERV